MPGPLQLKANEPEPVTVRSIDPSVLIQVVGCTWVDDRLGEGLTFTAAEAVEEQPLVVTVTVYVVEVAGLTVMDEETSLVVQT